MKSNKKFNNKLLKLKDILIPGITIIGRAPVGVPSKVIHVTKDNIKELQDGKW